MIAPAKPATAPALATTLDAARAYAARGWAVLPIRAGSKVPLTAHGIKDASRDPATIRKWWSRWPGAGVGIACGSLSSGLVVLDCDAAEFVWALEKSCGALPETYTVATGRGSHRYFISPEPIRTQTLAPHLEIRGEGAYVVAPPSVHENGSQYRVVNGVKPAPLSAALLEILRSPAIPSPATSTAAPEKIVEGERDCTLTSFGGSMRRRGMTPEAIEAALLKENAARCDPPLPEAEVRKVARSVSRYQSADEKVKAKSNAVAELATSATRRPSAATQLVKLAQAEVELFHSSDDGFATVRISTHLETYPLRSRSFRSWLSKIYFEHERKAPSGEGLTSAITTLEGFARFEHPERAVYVRLAGHNGRVFLDLGDAEWYVVEIDATGWRIIESVQCPIRFRRAHGMLALPLPKNGGDLRSLRDFLNVASDADFVLVSSWLLGTLHPTGPYPILVLHGEQGSAKTTTARVLRALIDPNVAPVRSEPRESRDLMIAAENGWFCAFDNLSTLPAWFSDCLCRLSTGGGFSTRALYTDQEEMIFSAKRPVILTGIEELATRGDLLDRAIIIYLPRIPEKKCSTEKKLFSVFEAACPQLLGALLSAASHALADYDKIVPDQVPRMADFSLWVVAAEPALGLKPGSFLSAYTANRSAANELPLETPVAEAVRKLFLPWTGTATELLAALETLIDDRTKRSKSWPSSGRGLSNALRRLASNLRASGVEIQFFREAGMGGRRLISLSESLGDSASQSSQRRRRDAGDAGDDEKRQSMEMVIPRGMHPEPEPDHASKVEGEL